MTGARRRHSPGRWALALLLVLAGSLFLAACGSNGDEARPYPTEEGAYRALPLGEPRPKPDFTLPDTSGEPFDFIKETEGYVTLLYFGYTTCPDICPGHLGVLTAAFAELPEEITSQVKFVFVTCDPARDTGERMRIWLDNFNEGFVGLRTQSQQETNNLGEEALGPFWAPLTNLDVGGGDYYVNHPAVIVAYTKDNLAHVAYPFGVKKSDWVHDLPKLVNEGWTGQ